LKEKDKHMNKYSNDSKLLMWVMALVLTGVVAGCGGGGGYDAGAGSGAGTGSPTAPGAGPGAGAGGYGPLPVNLGTAGNFVILAKSAISTTGTTAVTGNLGLSPAAASFITGFTLSAPPTTSTTSPLVTGLVFAADYDVPTPSNLTTAVLDMMTAYTDAAGRPADFTELGAGNIGGMTLPAGTYKWGTGVLIPTDVTLSGGPNDVWIFEIAQDLVMSSATRITLAGGALAKNIFWQVFGIVDIGTTAHFEGIALVQTAITLKTGASANGRLLAQTAVNLDANTVVQPAP
jgi:hypothetical protein